MQEVQRLYVGSSIGYTMFKMALCLSEFVRLRSCQSLESLTVNWDELSPCKLRRVVHLIVINKDATYLSTRRLRRKSSR